MKNRRHWHWMLLGILSGPVAGWAADEMDFGSVEQALMSMDEGNRKDLATAMVQKLDASPKPVSEPVAPQIRQSGFAQEAKNEKQLRWGDSGRATAPGLRPREGSLRSGPPEDGEAVSRAAFIKPEAEPEDLVSGESAVPPQASPELRTATPRGRWPRFLAGTSEIPDSSQILAKDGEPASLTVGDQVYWLAPAVPQPKGPGERYPVYGRVRRFLGSEGGTSVGYYARLGAIRPLGNCGALCIGRVIEACDMIQPGDWVCTRDQP